MQIAIFHDLPSGGAKRVIYEQVRRLSSNGHQISEFAPSTADINFCNLAPFVVRQQIFESRLPGLLRRRLPLITPYIHALQGVRRLNASRNSSQHIARRIEAKRFDVVLVTDSHIIPVPYVLRYLKIPTLSYCQDVSRLLGSNSSRDDSPRMSAFDRLRQKYYAPATALFRTMLVRDTKKNLHTATRVATNSQFAAQVLLERAKTQSAVIYPGIDTCIFQPQSLVKKPFVLCVGALTPQKGLKFLVSALGCMRPERRPDLFIAANHVVPNEEHAVRNLAARVGVRLHVERIDDDQRLVEVYNQASAFVYAPMHEAFGMAPLEAMACGTPVLAVSEGGVRETVLDGVTGWLVERDEQQFAAKLDALLCDDALRAQMGAAGVEYVRREWTWNRAVDRLEYELQCVGG